MERDRSRSGGRNKPEPIPTPDASLRQQPPPRKLGCGSLILLFVLIAIGGRYIPHDGRPADPPRPAARGGKPAAHGPETANGGPVRAVQPARNAARGETDSGGWLGWFGNPAKRVEDHFEAVGSRLRQYGRDIRADRWFPVPWRGANEAMAEATRTPAQERSGGARTDAKAGLTRTMEAPGGGTETGGKTGSGKDVVFNNPWDHSVNQVVKYLKHHAHDADSIEFLEWGPVRPAERGFQVRCRYRSKNVLGRYASQSKLFVLDRQGNVVEIMD